ncbi:MAG: amidohydrolase [Trueperaceae bacterium]
MNDVQPVVEAVAVRGDKILATGTEADMRAIIGRDVEIIDLNKRCLLPGFHDSHVHLTLHGLELSHLQLEKAQRLEEALGLIAERASKQPEGTWILGAGFLMSRWNLNELHKRDLDRVAPRHPVLLKSQDHHSSWVNSLALQQAGITSSTPQPEHGKIVRDDKGEATGMLLERASGLIQDVLPQPTRADIQQALKLAANHFASLGITTVHHMGAEPAHYFREFASLASEASFPIRVWACINQEDIEAALQLGIATGHGGEHFQIGGAKFFADGALGSMTALMLEAYTNTNVTGFPVHSFEYLLGRFPLAIKAGFVPVIHAIGDKANRDVLNALEQTKHLWQPLNMRPRIEHAQHLHSDDVPRFAKLGVIPSMQPIHYRFDAKRIAELLSGRLGQAHAWRALADTGAFIPLGSDTPIATPDVILGLQTVCTRVAEDGSVVGSQKLSLDEALAGYTKHAARAISWEHRSGQMKTGCDADFVVLSHNPVVLSHNSLEDLENLSVRATMKAGQWVFENQTLNV